MIKDRFWIATLIGIIVGSILWYSHSFVIEPLSFVVGFMGVMVIAMTIVATSANIFFNLAEIKFVNH